jgi:hypothetical protein
MTPEEVLATYMAARAHYAAVCRRYNRSSAARYRLRHEHEDAHDTMFKAKQRFDLIPWMLQVMHMNKTELALLRKGDVWALSFRGQVFTNGTMNYQQALAKMQQALALLEEKSP